MNHNHPKSFWKKHLPICTASQLAGRQQVLKRTNSTIENKLKKNHLYKRNMCKQNLDKFGLSDPKLLGFRQNMPNTRRFVLPFFFWLANFAPRLRDFSRGSVGTIFGHHLTMSVNASAVYFSVQGNFYSRKAHHKNYFKTNAKQLVWNKKQQHLFAKTLPFLRVCVCDIAIYPIVSD